MHKRHKQKTFHTSYTLVTERGHIMKFHTKGMAELYKNLEGGVITVDTSQNGVHKSQN